MKQEFINMALSQLGYKETGKNYTKYGEWYGVNPGAWCDMFVCWCANKAGVPKSLIPKYCNCGDTRKWYEKKNLLFDKPSVGDLGLVMKKVYNKDKKKYVSSAQHIFIVEYIDGKKVHTIEGNLSDKVKRNTRTIGYNNLKGLLFCKVQWDENYYTGEFPTLPARGYFKKGDKSKEVIKLQKLLNWALDIKLQTDGSYGSITKDAVVRFEKLVGAKKKNGLFGGNDLKSAKAYTK